MRLMGLEKVGVASLSWLFNLFALFGETCVSHPLAQASLLKKILFQAFDLLAQKVVRLVDQTDNNIRYNRPGTHFKEHIRPM